MSKKLRDMKHWLSLVSEIELISVSTQFDPDSMRKCKLDRYTDAYFYNSLGTAARLHNVSRKLESPKPPHYGSGIILVKKASSRTFQFKLYSHIAGVSCQKQFRFTFTDYDIGCGRFHGWHLACQSSTLIPPFK